MAAKSNETLDDLIKAGVRFEVRHAIRTNGAMEAKAWFDDPANEAAVVKFDHLFRKVCAGERIFNQQQFRKLRDGIFEFKRDANRLLCFQEGRCWRITHHYPKGSNKCPEKQIERAIRIREEHRARQGK